MYAEITLTRGQVTVVDMVDLPLIAGTSWQAHPGSDRKGYYAASPGGIRMHRLIMAVTGEVIVDHRDGDGLNNRRSNLRVGTQSQNCVNRLVTPGQYLRGARPKNGLWQAYIKFKGKQRSLGCFHSEREAHDAYVVEARILHGDWMPLPEPPEATCT